MRKWRFKKSRGVVECKGGRVTNLAEAADALNRLEEELEGTVNDCDQYQIRLEEIRDSLLEFIEEARWYV